MNFLELFLQSGWNINFSSLWLDYREKKNYVICGALIEKFSIVCYINFKPFGSQQSTCPLQFYTQFSVERYRSKIFFLQSYKPLKICSVCRSRLEIMEETLVYPHAHLFGLFQKRTCQYSLQFRLNFSIWVLCYYVTSVIYFSSMLLSRPVHFFPEHKLYIGEGMCT